MSEPSRKADAAPREETATREVGSEGGSDGELEIGRTGTPGVGGEAGETWSPAQQDTTEIRRDETGDGKRTPND